MKRLVYTTAFLLTISLISCSCKKEEDEDAAPDAMWSHTIDYVGLTAADKAVAVVQTTDQGFVVAGNVYKTFPNGTRTVSFLMKFDPQGNMLWTREYGDETGTTFEASALIGCRDGGLMLAGTIGTYRDERDFFAVKTDSAGDIMWSNTYGGAQEQECLAAIGTSDNGFLLAGNTRSYGDGHTDCYLIKIGSSGTQEWARHYGGTKNDEFRSVSQSPDGGFIAAGETLSFGPNTPSEDRNNMYVIRTNSEGQALWTRSVGTDLWEAANSVTATSDSGCIVAGFTNAVSYYQWYGYLARLSASGQVVWETTYGSHDAEFSIIHCVIATADNRIVYTGEGLGRTEGDVHVAALDMGGTTIWESFYGANGAAETGLCITQAMDGGYIACGKAEYDLNSTCDSYVVRF